MSDQARWLSLPEALEAIKNSVSPRPEQTQVPLTAALDNVAAQVITAPLNVPGYDNSAMDGYAVIAADANAGNSLRVIGEAFAGHPFSGEVTPGTCVRIMTGAMLPAGADAVIMQEQTDRTEQGIHCQAALCEGDNIRLAGSDLAAGETIIRAGQRLRPVDIGLLASMGIAEVTVNKPLRVATFSTGDELVPPGQPLKSGQIYDSNRYTIQAMLSRLNIEVIDLGLIRDDPEAIAAAFKKAMSQADVIVTSAGVSIGDADYTKDVMAQLGEINFWKIAMKPGKPFAFGKLGESWFCGLPGNPVAAVVTLNQIVQPLLRYLAGEDWPEQTMYRAVASKPIRKKPGRADFQRGRLTQAGDQLEASPVGSQSSGVLSSVANANCFILLEQDRGNVAAGETVTVLPFDRLLQ
ncbi:molybdopterin molybdotransferase MoeA [Pseudidiomarina sp.]|uniref:molybdopterin molybdotransferase MoeA n=1 Tax=Pseudidiomarina sp. TaxID=2081707 RepID=UPI00299DADBA|nr:molybdopterin molybdotransferase MoeA [Pseudidiomarina sp.]MDX1705909.1 molybdopterin molybdotransferase MoeA [Pseudidiomarina sp.]